MMKINRVLFLVFFSYCSLYAVPSAPEMHQGYLPEKITLFLDSHFANYKIEKFKYDSDSGECKVKYTNGIKVEFDHRGNWEDVESDYIPLPKSIIDILPIRAIDFIAHRYQYKPIKRIKRKHDGYKVKLDKSIDILFDYRGNIIKMDD